MSKVISIVYKPENGTPSGETYLRVPIEQVQLVADYGIEGDAKGGTFKRHLNLMSDHCLDQLNAEGFQTTPGEMGEQLIVSDLELEKLPVGTRLQIGAEACVELTEPRTGCAKFEKYQDKKREEAAGRLGMMANVVVGGKIAVGDAVQVLGTN